jgi:hypothetical protein
VFAKVDDHQLAYINEIAETSDGSEVMFVTIDVLLVMIDVLLFMIVMRMFTRVRAYT